MSSMSPWLWSLPVILFTSVFLAQKWELVGGVLLIITSVLIFIWDVITGDFGLPYFHLIVVIGGIIFIFLWRKKYRPLRTSID
jgi:hypothetical protein